MTVVGRRSCSFQHVSITVNQSPRDTNKRYKIIPVCTTNKFPEAHNYVIIIKYVKGIFMNFNYYNQLYFLFPNDTIGKSEVIYTYVVSCTVSLNDTSMCTTSQFFSDIIMTW